MLSGEVPAGYAPVAPGDKEYELLREKLAQSERLIKYVSFLGAIEELLQQGKVSAFLSLFLTIFERVNERVCTFPLI
jgi:hypothetical protein